MPLVAPTAALQMTTQHILIIPSTTKIMTMLTFNKIAAKICLWLRDKLLTPGKTSGRQRHREKNKNEISLSDYDNKNTFR